MPSPPPAPDPAAKFYDTARESGLRVSGLHGYPEGVLKPFIQSTALQMYNYFLTDKEGKRKCRAGFVTNLECRDRVCTGHFYENGVYRNASDPDARMSFHMSPDFREVDSMSIRHNNSDRFFQQYVYNNGGEVKVPTISLPGQQTANTVSNLIYNTASNVYTLTDKDKKLQGYVEIRSCDDALCEGDLTLNGGPPKSHQIQFTMTSDAVHDGTSYRDVCRDPVFENVSCIRLKHREQDSWSVRSKHCS